MPLIGDVSLAATWDMQYPGGPEIEELAAAGNPQAIDFPRALLKEDYQFSFSGLKSAVINYLHNEQQAPGGWWLARATFRNLP